MDRRKLTREELEQLAPFEKNMATAVQSDWTRGIGRRGIALMKAIKEAVTGKAGYVNAGCPSCVLTLVREVGRWYFADKDTLIEDAPVEAPTEPVGDVTEAVEESVQDAPEIASEVVFEAPEEAPVEASPEEPAKAVPAKKRAGKKEAQEGREP